MNYYQAAAGRWEDERTAEEIIREIKEESLMIVSTAITHNMILVTNNEKHFRRIEALRTEN